EFREYAKLLRKVGLGPDWPAAREAIDPGNAYAARFRDYLMPPRSANGWGGATGAVLAPEPARSWLRIEGRGGSALGPPAAPDSMTHWLPCAGLVRAARRLRPALGGLAAPPPFALGSSRQLSEGVIIFRRLPHSVSAARLSTEGVCLASMSSGILALISTSRLTKRRPRAGSRRFHRSRRRSAGT